MASTSADSITFKRPGKPDLVVTPSVQAAVVVAGLKSGVSGFLDATHLGLLLLALGWPDSESCPWTVAAQEALNAAEGKLKMYRAEMQGRGAALSDVERSELRRDLKAAAAEVEACRAALAAAQVTDLPINPQVRSETARRVEASLVAVGVPPAVVARWAAELLSWADKASTAGYEQWEAWETEGFLTPPAEGISSGDASLPTGSAEMPSAGPA